VANGARPTEDTARRRLEIAFSLLWFLGAILYVRTGARERRRLGKAVEASIVANGARPTEDTARRRLEK